MTTAIGSLIYGTICAVDWAVCRLQDSIVMRSSSWLHETTPYNILDWPQLTKLYIKAFTQVQLAIVDKTACRWQDYFVRLLLEMTTVTELCVDNDRYWCAAQTTVDSEIDIDIIDIFTQVSGWLHTITECTSVQLDLSTLDNTARAEQGSLPVRISFARWRWAQGETTADSTHCDPQP